MLLQTKSSDCAKSKETPSVDAYLLEENIAVKFHPDNIRNDGAVGFFEERRPSNKKKNKRKNINMSSQRHRSQEARGIAPQ